MKWHMCNTRCYNKLHVKIYYFQVIFATCHSSVWSKVTSNWLSKKGSGQCGNTRPPEGVCKGQMTFSSVPGHTSNSFQPSICEDTTLEDRCKLHWMTNQECKASIGASWWKQKRHQCMLHTVNIISCAGRSGMQLAQGWSLLTDFALVLPASDCCIQLILVSRRCLCLQLVLVVIFFLTTSAKPWWLSSPATCTGVFPMPIRYNILPQLQN